MILDFLTIAIQFVAAGLVCVAVVFLFAVTIGIVDLATTPGHSDWYEDRSEV